MNNDKLFVRRDDGRKEGSLSNGMSWLELRKRSLKGSKEMKLFLGCGCGSSRHSQIPFGGWAA